MNTEQDVGRVPDGTRLSSSTEPQEGLRPTGFDPSRAEFVPCPVCKQYSHSIGSDKLAAAFMHFDSMYAHPLRGTPMGYNFDERTRDYAQVLMAAARAYQSLNAGGSEEGGDVTDASCMTATRPRT